MMAALMKLPLRESCWLFAEELLSSKRKPGSSRESVLREKPQFDLRFAV
jgi:hypothetical protein